MTTNTPITKPATARRKNSRRQHAGANWQDVRSRLTTAINATKGSFELSPEQSAAVLATRAKALSAAAPAPGSGGSGSSGAVVGAVEVVEAVFFELGGAPYAIEASHVREIRRLGSFCRVPGVPGFVVGLTALRGETLAILDLRMLLGMTDAPLNEATRLIVLGAEGTGNSPEFAIIAEAVEQTAMLPLADLLEAGETVRGEHKTWVRGITAQGRTLLNAQALLADERLMINQDTRQSET